MYFSNSPRNLRMAFFRGQAAPSAKPQIVVPGMMPIVSPISSNRSRSIKTTLPCLDAIEHLQRPRSTFATGSALPATLVSEESGAVMQEVDHAIRSIVDNNNRRRTQTEATVLAGPIEIERTIEFIGRQQTHADPTGNRCFRLATFPDAAAIVFDQLDAP